MVIIIIFFLSFRGLIEMGALMEDKTYQELLEDNLKLKQKIRALEQSSIKSAQAIEALKDSEERFRSLVEMTSDWIWEIDARGIYTYASPKIKDILGYEPSEILGKTAMDLMPPEEAKRVAKIMDEYFEGAKAFTLFENINLHKDGRTVVLETSGVPIIDENGSLKGYRGIDRDISEYKKAEKLLRESEKRYRTLFEESIDGIFITSHEGRFLDVNKACIKIFGYDSKDEMLHLDLARDVYADPKDRANVLSTLREQGSIEIEIPFRKKGGNMMLTRFSSTAIKDEQDHIIFYRSVVRDITAVRKMETTAQDTLRFLETIIDTIPIPIVYRDTELRYKGCNNAFAMFIGLKKEEIIGKTLYDLYPKERADEYYERDMALLHQPEKLGQAFEHQLIRADGSVRDILFNRATFRNSAGAVEGLVSVMVDLTERKHAENELRRSEATLRSVFKATPVGLSLVKDRVFQEVNKAWLKILGYSESEIIGRSARLVYESDEEFERVGRALFTNLLECGLTSVQTVLRKKDGERRDVILTAAPFQAEDRYVGMAVVAIEDITERNRVENELHIKDELLYMASKLEKIGGFEVDALTHKGTWTDEVTNIHDLDPTHLNTNLEMGISFYVGESQDKISEAVREAIELAKPYDLELELMSAKGIHKIVRTMGHPVMKGGRVVKVQGIIQDITKRKNDEQERKVLEEKLQRAEKMEALGMLAGGVAHDLNNVLGIVVGFAELLLRTQGESNPIRPQLENIVRGGQRAAAIVDDLLTLARRGVASRQVLNLNKIISDLQQSPELGKLCEHHPQVEIKTDLAQPLLNISGSSIHLSKSLFNLVSNASEAMPQGGILTIKTANQYLDKPIKGYDEVREGDYVVLSVSDTGEGILAADLKHIFEPFYTKKVMGRSGTGLGLSVVWGTVKDHQGYIDIQSEEGKGSTFTLYFPITREEISPESEAIALSTYMGKGQSILVVDDVKEQRDLAVGMLRKLNYDVTSVASGEEAIAFVKKHPFDLIILDMIMEPGMDGLDTYKKIIEAQPHQKAIIVSGYAETDRVKQAQELGAGAFVKKPYVLENIGLAVYRQLGSK